MATATPRSPYPRRKLCGTWLPLRPSALSLPMTYVMPLSAALDGPSRARSRPPIAHAIVAFTALAENASVTVVGDDKQMAPMPGRPLSVMPITSTKKRRLSSGLGVRISRYARWATSGSVRPAYRLLVPFWTRYCCGNRIYRSVQARAFGSATTNHELTFNPDHLWGPTTFEQVNKVAFGPEGGQYCRKGISRSWSHRMSPIKPIEPKRAPWNRSSR